MGAKRANCKKRRFERLINKVVWDHRCESPFFTVILIHSRGERIMAVWHRWAFRFFERFRYRRSFFRQAARLGASDTWPENFLGLVQSLDTPFRLAGFMEEKLHEQSKVRIFEVTKSSIIKLLKTGSNIAV